MTWNVLDTLRSSTPSDVGSLELLTFIEGGDSSPFAMIGGKIPGPQIAPQHPRQDPVGSSWSGPGWKLACSPLPQKRGRTISSGFTGASLQPPDDTSRRKSLPGLFQHPPVSSQFDDPLRDSTNHTILISSSSGSAPKPQAWNPNLGSGKRNSSNANSGKPSPARSSANSGQQDTGIIPSPITDNLEQGDDADTIQIIVRLEGDNFLRPCTKSRSDVMEPTFCMILDRFIATINETHVPPLNRIEHYYRLDPQDLHERYLADKDKPIRHLFPSPSGPINITVYCKAPNNLDRISYLVHQNRILSEEIQRLQSRNEEFVALERSILEPLALRTALDEALTGLAKPGALPNDHSDKPWDIRASLKRMDKPQWNAAVNRMRTSQPGLSRAAVEFLLNPSQWEAISHAGNAAAHPNLVKYVDACLERRQLSPILWKYNELKEILRLVYPYHTFSG
ncbi:hypothetical protein BDN72DRAFT_193803 [Pluteus cervinus]|uniref:Uncharacterized protein n=1 Tax=Pluteus cervinus TaxID=181527 RepID=A0ACD3AIG4_9AGAR|nr:hypothetical protein BDN72DRAFT_193803 [Pluteus cervinus]